MSIVQSTLHWENATANRAMFTELLAPMAGTTDLVVLPEMFTTGFSMRARELAETMDGPTVTWMRERAKELNAALYGSVIITEEGKYHNRGMFVRPDGSVTVYDKRHLFSFANEHEHYAPGMGREQTVVEWRGWRILLQICYDLRFPVFARNRRNDGYDAVCYVANWPGARRHPWSTLLLARAIENQAYVIGVNRVGGDGNGHPYSGDSVIIDPRGQVIAGVGSSQTGIATATLDLPALIDFRAKFPAGNDADDFKLI